MTRSLLVASSFFLGEYTIWNIARFENPWAYVVWAVPAIAIGLCEIYVLVILGWILAITYALHTEWVHGR